MSFRCYYTGKVAPACTRAVKVIIEVRQKEYAFRAKAIPVRRGGRKKKQFRDDKGGAGWERVREVMMTPEGARMFAESAEGQTLLAQMEAWSGPMRTDEAEPIVPTKSRRNYSDDDDDDDDDE